MEIEHDNGYVYRYNHLSSFENFEAGDEIQAGQTIGIMGNTGKVGSKTG
jgi:murein DD-endopeptidase MepM/ murein hydrolase activator NlpD